MTKIYFASNRDVRRESSKSGDNFGDRFNADGPQCFRVGEAKVTLTGDDPKDDASWKVGLTRLYAEDLNSQLEHGAKLGSARLFEELRLILKSEDVDVIIYIHGFANSFQNSVQRAAALQALYTSDAQKIIVVMFSWPSNGRVQPAWNYFSDREDAEASGLAMGRALARLVEFLAELRREDRATITEARKNGVVPDRRSLKQCTSRLHVMAHSMGNYALRHALLKYANINGGQIDRVLDCTFLMAADEDNDALTVPLKLKGLEELSNRVFVYHAANDIMLTISDRTKGMPKRLGSDGPENLDRTGERVFALDCRKISDTDLVHGRHQYYRLRDEAIRDIRDTLADIPQEERPNRQTIRPGRSWRLREN